MQNMTEHEKQILSPFMYAHLSMEQSHLGLLLLYFKMNTSTLMSILSSTSETVITVRLEMT